MAAKSFFLKGIEKILAGTVILTSDTIKAALMNIATMDTAKSVTNATNATPIVVTIATHGYANGDVVLINGVTGNTNANGKFIVAGQTTNTINLTSYPDGTNVAGNGTFGGTAFALNLSTVEFYADVDAGVIGTPQTLGTKTFTGGAFDSADSSYTAVTGAVITAVVRYKDTGSAATSPLLHIADDYSGMPLTPNGGDISLVNDNGVNKIWRILL